MYWKPTDDGTKPEGAIDGRNFFVTPAMMSILGATHEDMELILKGLGYRAESRLEVDVKPAEATADKVETPATSSQEPAAAVNDETTALEPAAKQAPAPVIPPPPKGPVPNLRPKPVIPPPPKGPVPNLRPKQIQRPSSRPITKSKKNAKKKKGKSRRKPRRR